MAAAAGIIAAGTALAAPTGDQANKPAASPVSPAAPLAAAPSGRIPTSTLAIQPFISGPVLSPDGKQFAARLLVNGKKRLAIIAIQGKTPAILLSVDSSNDLRWYRWAGNDKLLVSIGKSVPVDGDEAYATRLVAFNAATSKITLVGGLEEGLVGDDILWLDPEGKTILLSYQKTVYEYPSVNRIDLTTGRSSQVVGQRADIWDWYADDGGIVRIGSGYNDSNHYQMLYRANAAESFRTVVHGKIDINDASFDAAQIHAGSDEGYLTTNDGKSGLYGLYKYNFATLTKGDLVYATPKDDIDDYDLDFEGKSLAVAWYTDDRQRAMWFDPKLKEIQDSIDKAVGTRAATIVSRSRDNSVMLVHVGASNDPGAYYFYQPADGTMRVLARRLEGLSSTQLVATRYVHYKARDGLEIPAYLTVPKDRAAKNLPLIIMPHGGPYDVRDDGGFDQEVQFYANRGYAVLQPEYRGSGGYGRFFYSKGEGQWGRAMQDDIDDGMDWLAKEGTIDPKRVCLIGSSYGGYAALWGATRNPERYRCAASFAGISDLARELKYQLDVGISKRYRSDWRRTVQGGPGFDLKTVSPLYTIDKLRVPVLLMHGDKDQRVPYKQSKLMADALKAAGKTYEFYTLPGEIHGFSSSANMQQWFDRLDAFLAKYNPAD